MTASTEPTFVDETLELGAVPARRELGVVHGWLAEQSHMVGHLLHHPQLAGRTPSWPRRTT